MKVRGLLKLKAQLNPSTYTHRHTAIAARTGTTTTTTTTTTFTTAAIASCLSDKILVVFSFVVF